MMKEANEEANYGKQQEVGEISTRTERFDKCRFDKGESGGEKSSEKKTGPGQADVTSKTYLTNLHSCLGTTGWKGPSEQDISPI